MKKEYEFAVIAALLVLPFAVLIASQSLIASHHFFPESGIDFYCDFGAPTDCLASLGGKSGTMVILVQYLEEGSVANAQMTLAFSELILAYGSTGRVIQLQLETANTCTIVDVSDPSDMGTTLDGPCSFSPSEENPVIAILFPSGQREKSDVFISREGISIQPRTWEHLTKIVQAIRNIVAPDVYERMGDVTGAFNNSS